jgi:hypothetical protein
LSHKNVHQSIILEVKVLSQAGEKALSENKKKTDQTSFIFAQKKRLSLCNQNAFITGVAMTTTTQYEIG